MEIIPLGSRLIIAPEKKRERASASGLVSSASFDKTEELHGEVIAVGPDVSVVKKGDLVSFPAYGYDTVSPNDGTDLLYMSVREQDVLAVIKGRVIKETKTN